MPQFQMEISLGGVLLIIGQILTFAAFIWKRSGVEAEQRSKIDINTSKIVAVDGRVDVLGGRIDAEIGRVESEFEAKFTALSGAQTLMRENHHELREHLANSYMKREEIAAMERRVTDGQSAISQRIGKIEDRLDTMQTSILAAIADLKVSGRPSAGGGQR
jgi:hypothetical protein